MVVGKAQVVIFGRGKYVVIAFQMFVAYQLLFSENPKTFHRVQFFINSEFSLCFRCYLHSLGTVCRIVRK